MADGDKSVLARIQGRVQGVWYRGWAVQEARSRGLSGWVRNRSDGSVEALVSGPKAAVNDLLDAFWQGPPAAKVTRVDVQTASPPGVVLAT
jgi:acylphosphatase